MSHHQTDIVIFRMTCDTSRTTIPVLVSFCFFSFFVCGLPVGLLCQCTNTLKRNPNRRSITLREFLPPVSFLHLSALPIPPLKCHKIPLKVIPVIFSRDLRLNSRF